MFPWICFWILCVTWIGITHQVHRQQRFYVSSLLVVCFVSCIEIFSFMKLHLSIVDLNSLTTRLFRSYLHLFIFCRVLTIVASSKIYFRLRSLNWGLHLEWIFVQSYLDTGLISLFCMWTSIFLNTIIEDASLGTMLVFWYLSKFCFIVLV